MVPPHRVLQSVAVGAAAIVAILAATTCCGGDKTTGPSHQTPSALAKIGGDGQTGPVAQPLPTALQVKVTDAQGGGVAGVAVTWAVVAGGGSVGASSSTTNASGLASVSWTLGPLVGANSVAASVASLASVTFTATAVAGAAAKLTLTVQPSNATAGSALSPAIQVSVQDAQGNIVTSATPSIALSITPGTGTAGSHLRGTATISASSGVATFASLSIDSAGTAYTLTASATGLTSAASSVFNVAAAPGTKLAFSVQPTGAAAGASISPAVAVVVLDSLGNKATAATPSITIGITSGTGTSGAVLGGTLTVAAVSGVATFSTLTVDKVGSGYTLSAISGALTGATSSAFTISVGAAAKLAFTVQPTNGTAGTALAPAVQVTVQDAGGNTVTGSTASLTLAITNGTGVVGATLSGTSTKAASAGVATYSDLSIDKAGTGYTLTASALGLASTTSSSFVVTAGAPATVAVQAGNSQSALAGTPVAIPPAVIVKDALGNVKPGASVTFAVASGGGSVTGATQATNTSGIAAVGSWTLGSSGSNTLTATVAGSGMTGNPVTFTATATTLTLTTVQPDTLVEGQTATLTGAGFSTTPASNTVTIDGAAATVTAASATHLTVTVPSYDCRPARDGGVQVAVGGVNSNTVTKRIHPTSFVDLAVGAQQIVQTPANFCLQFRPSTVGGDGYLIGLGAAAESPSTLFPVTISTGTGAASAPVFPPAVLPEFPRPSPASQVVQTATEVEVDRLWRHQYEAEARIRAWERDQLPLLVRQTRPVAGAPRIARSMSAVPSVGDTLRIRVPDYTVNGCANYAEILTKVKAVGTAGIWVSDPANPGPDSLTDAEIQGYSDTFDTKIYAGDTTYFGTPSDLDNNQRVVIVLTIAVNREPIGAAGFVSGTDLVPRNVCASSNLGELFYGDVPDPGNVAGTGARTHAAVSWQMPSLIAHEFSHDIQLSRRLVLANGTSMNSWEMEGQAMMAQEVVGHQVLGNSAGQNYTSTVALGTQGAPWYKQIFDLLGSYFGSKYTLTGKNTNAPDQCSLYANTSISLACFNFAFYGASWSFQRYVVDRFGPSYPGGATRLTRDVISKNVNLAGRANWENLLGLSPAGYDSLYAQWGAMLYLDDRVAAATALQQMSSWNLFNILNAYGTTDYLLIPTARTFTAFSDAWSVRGGGTAYTTLTSTGARPALAVKIRDGAGAVIGAAMRAQLWVTRIQ